MMIFRLIALLSILVLVACTSTSLTSTLSETPTPVPPCGVWQVSDDTLICIASGDTLLIQSSNEQVTLRAYAMSIVLSGTIALLHDESLRILVLEGDAVIGVNGQNPILSSGREVAVEIVDNHAQAPSVISPITNLPENLPLDDLPRAIDVTSVILTSTPIPTAIPTANPDNCPIPDNWTDTYTISSGDTLEGIANRYDLTVEELAEGNCLTNIARISVGQELFVPIDDVVESESTESVPQAISIGFRADDYAIPFGTCTVLRWDAFNSQAIYLDNQLVNASSFQEICPETTASFTLRVVLSDEQEETRELTVTVQE